MQLRRIIRRKGNRHRHKSRRRSLLRGQIQRIKMRTVLQRVRIHTNQEARRNISRKILTTVGPPGMRLSTSQITIRIDRLRTRAEIRIGLPIR